jgi:peptide/nickel transport system permease protein
MLVYAVRRILQSIPILFVVLTLVFGVVRVLPGDPATAALGDYASKEAVSALRERMGLNDSLPVQYFQFLGNLLRGTSEPPWSTATRWAGRFWPISPTPSS